jgi:hypothetical protein
VQGPTASSQRVFSMANGTTLLLCQCFSSSIFTMLCWKEITTADRWVVCPPPY